MWHNARVAFCYCGMQLMWHTAHVACCRCGLPAQDGALERQCVVLLCRRHYSVVVGLMKSFSSEDIVAELWAQLAAAVGVLDGWEGLLTSSAVEQMLQVGGGEWGGVWLAGWLAGCLCKETGLWSGRGRFRDAELERMRRGGGRGGMWILYV